MIKGSPLFVIWYQGEFVENIAKMGRQPDI